MLTYIQAIILGAVQGITELFPVSSLGHSVILPSILGWKINQGADFFLIFLVATHFATALVLFIYFWKDWKRIIWGLLRSIKKISIARRCGCAARLAISTRHGSCWTSRSYFPEQITGFVRFAKICLDIPDLQRPCPFCGRIFEKEETSGHQ